MSLRWLCLTTTLTLLFTSSGIWLEARLKGSPSAKAASIQSVEAQPETQLQLLITGAVNKPGLYHLPAGSKVSELLTQAGGPTAQAQLSALNLQASLHQGQVVHLPESPVSASLDSASLDSENPAAESSTEAEPSIKAQTLATRQLAARPARKLTKKSKLSKISQPVNLNQATLADLDSLPGVGPALAQRILEWRKAHGRFNNLNELLQVKGIGAKKLAKFQQLIRL